ncbi:uncharacterized protein N7498_006613 [Penicillium cinerascens]|uniref:Uncharacterized protein n=1 Tax=Penicillium cinerascens TaxID=70096 RepID=A0A9W9SXW1_9EURO|nr:uncharacterized protein N7498_006613 [Penicillium cinerascens]KAJ5201950.1 hypothetical protein N7498_006613 [Penicillium cinerascens]
MLRGATSTSESVGDNQLTPEWSAKTQAKNAAISNAKQIPSPRSLSGLCVRCSDGLPFVP